MILRIGFVILILVAMVTILAGKYRLLSYQHTHIYKMKECHFVTIATVIIVVCQQNLQVIRMLTLLYIPYLYLHYGLSYAVKLVEVIVTMATKINTFSPFNLYSHSANILQHDLLSFDMVFTMIVAECELFYYF